MEEMRKNREVLGMVSTRQRGRWLVTQCLLRRLRYRLSDCRVSSLPRSPTSLTPVPVGMCASCPSATFPSSPVSAFCPRPDGRVPVGPRELFFFELNASCCEESDVPLREEVFPHQGISVHVNADFELNRNRYFDESKKRNFVDLLTITEPSRLGQEGTY